VTGYGAFLVKWETGFPARSIGAHIVAYEVSTASEIPDGYEIHHLCRRRECCNPAHLQMLTKSDHARIR
jgi:hypothetical protein